MLHISCTEGVKCSIRRTIMAQDLIRDKWSAQAYNANASFVYSDVYTSPILSMLNPKPGEKIYDFGCGSGDLSVQIAKIVGEEGVVVGVDSSESMVRNRYSTYTLHFGARWNRVHKLNVYSQIGQARKNGLTHAFVSDIQAISFPKDLAPEHRSGFDAVFSNAALHWCKRNPKGVIESVKTILKPGGRFVAEMGGYMNCIGELHNCGASGQLLT